MAGIGIKARFTYRFVKELELVSDGSQADNVDVVERTDQPGRWFVRKVYKFKGLSTTLPGAQKRFLSEFRILSSLRHPHIVPLIDYEYLPQQKRRWEAYIYMEYCRFGDLSQFIPSKAEDGRQRLSQGQLWDVIHQLGTALLYCHTGIVITEDRIDLEEGCDRPVLHRDIKPQNVLVSHRDGERIRVKLCDFGLGKHEKSALSKSYVGTYGYIAPEISRETSSWTPKADIYSFGATMSMIAGDPAEDEKLETFLEDCLQKNPNLRPTTVRLVNNIRKRLPAQTSRESIAREAASKGLCSILELLHSLNEDILEASANGETLLHEASERGWSEVICCLYRLGVDLGMKTNRKWDSKYAPMQLTVENGKLASVDQLYRLEQDAGVRTGDGRTGEGYTPMHIAAYTGRRNQRATLWLAIFVIISTVLFLIQTIIRISQLRV